VIWAERLSKRCKNRASPTTTRGRAEIHLKTDRIRLHAAVAPLSQIDVCHH
jgi:hypothetical protein